MNERKPFGTQFCPQYHTDVEFFIETSFETGRTLVARYQDSGSEDLPIVGLKSLPPGTYKVRWRVLSVDTHRTEGTFSFRVGQ